MFLPKIRIRGLKIALAKSDKLIPVTRHISSSFSTNAAKLTIVTDIWSFGCTTIELLTGTPPYYELNTMSALYKIVQDAHPPLPKCQNKVSALL